jgi:hypothetical protein
MFQVAILSAFSASAIGARSRVREPYTQRFVGRGDATAPNPNGVPITHRFVCVIDPDSGRGVVWFRSSNPEMYAETVRMFGL